jgi:hypothetical protein
MSLKSEWENEVGSPYTLLEALKVNALVTSLVLSIDEMRAAARARETAIRR